MNVDGQRFNTLSVISLRLVALATGFALMLAGGGRVSGVFPGAAIAFGLFCCIVGAGCFFVYRKFPGSALYVLILGNALGVVILVLVPSIQQHGEWAFVTACGLAETVTALIAVARNRRKRT